MLLLPVSGVGQTGDSVTNASHAGFMRAAVITASVSVFVAVVAFVLNEVARLRQEIRQARLERVNCQLRELYGPLNALVAVNERLWEALRVTSVPAKELRYAGGGNDYWRGWRDLALMPANRDMRDLIVTRADLLVEDQVPRPLLDFCAHVAAREVALGQAGGGVEALISHPGAEYIDYVRFAFAGLKGEQQRLLRRRVGRVRVSIGSRRHSTA